MNKIDRVSNFQYYVPLDNWFYKFDEISNEREESYQKKNNKGKIKYHFHPFFRFGFIKIMDTSFKDP